MRLVFVGALLCVALATLSACGGSNGEEAPPPTNVAVTPGDGRVTVTFTGQSGVDYWIFYAPGTGLTADNWVTVPGAAVRRNAQSPQVIGGLVNGQAYSLAMNGRRNGGPGGPGTGTFVVTPRLAGANWVAGTSLSNVELRGGVLLGTATVVGTGGAIFNTSDGRVFNQASSGVTADLNDIAVSGTVGSATYFAVGANGTILSSSNTTLWTTRTSGTSRDLNSIALGAGRWVAVGDNGTIVTSSDGNTFAAATSGTSANLLRVVYSGRFVAVGTGGTIVSSTDGLSWQSTSSNTTEDLRALSIGSGRFVALGGNGANLISADGLSWTAQQTVGAVNFRSVTRGNQFVAVGTGGAIYTSTDGTSWTAQNSGTTVTLNSVSLLGDGYLAVGDSGVNLTSR